MCIRLKLAEDHRNNCFGLQTVYLSPKNLTVRGESSSDRAEDEQRLLVTQGRHRSSDRPKYNRDCHIINCALVRHLVANIIARINIVHAIIRFFLDGGRNNTQFHCYILLM